MQQKRVTFTLTVVFDVSRDIPADQDAEDAAVEIGSYDLILEALELGQYNTEDVEVLDVEVLDEDGITN